MATTYNTLSLESREKRKTRPIAAYLAAGLLVVALAGAGTYSVGSNHESLAVNAEFSAFAGDVVTCRARAGASAADQRELYNNMPKYDPDFSDKSDGDKAFYNACYYSYACCTEVSLSCLASEGYGPQCEKCLFSNGPKMVLPLCKNFLENYSAGKPNAEPGQTFSRQDIIDDTKGLPSTTVQAQKQLMDAKKETDVSGKNSCWRPVGEDDGRMKKYVQNCWDAISWCNLLCPRDDRNTVNEKMCKECINLGFQQLAPARFVQDHTFKSAQIKQSQINKAKTAAELKKEAEALEWNAKFSGVN